MSNFGSAFGPVTPPAPTADERRHNEIVDALLGIQMAQDAMVAVLQTMAAQERVEHVVEAAGGADLTPLLEVLSQPHPIPPSAEALAEALARRLPDYGPTLDAVAQGLTASAKNLERLNKKVTAMSVMPSGGASGHVIVDSGTVTLTGSEFPWSSTDRAIANDIKRSVTDYETRLDYGTRTDANPVRVGKAPAGTAPSATTWDILTLEYDASARLNRSTPSTGAWA